MFSKKIFNGNERTILIKKNIAGSFLIKGWNCIVQLLLVPITLNCLNQYEYGIWLTISSILLWIDQFDIGLGNGLRNKLAEALAKGDKEKARRLVSTTFMMLIIIVIPILFILRIIIDNIDLYSILNINRATVPNLENIFIISIVFVGVTFIFKFIGNVYLGLQLPAINNLLVVSGQTLALIGIFVLSLIYKLTLFDVACIYTLSPLIIYLISYPVTFCKYKYLRPSFRLFDKAELNELFSLGILFFIVQISGLVIFASSNVLITRILSPAEVTPYQISYKYFSLTIMIFTIITAPLWSATTDAYTKNDWKWINSMMNKMNKIMLGFLGILIIMLASSELIYRIWIGGKVEIGYMLSTLMAVYMCVLIYSTCYSNILFGIGKIRLITIITALEAIIYIPLAIILGHRFGLYGIICALISVNLICTVCNKIQFERLAHNTARGIWNK